jgi:hypothetical protein
VIVFPHIGRAAGFTKLIEREFYDLKMLIGTGCADSGYRSDDLN